MTDAPKPPPIDPEIDLRDYAEFPLEFDRVFDSDTWARWTDRERVVGLRLWCKAWHQEPCASLPADDRSLAKLAGYGEAPEGLRAWVKVKAAVLDGGGWIMCADGRWYHSVVAEKAIDKWRTKRRKAVENQADAERKRRKRATDKSPVSGVVSGGQNPPVHPENGAEEGKGREEKKEPYPETERSTTSRATRLIEIFDRVRTEIFGAEHARPWPQSTDAVHAQRAIDAGWTEHAAELLFRDRMAKRREQGKPPPGGLAWFEKPFAEASPAARTAEDVSDDDPRAKAFVAAGNAWLALTPDARRKTPRPTREAFGLPPASEASP
jgi:hypothetical protein